MTAARSAFLLSALLALPAATLAQNEGQIPTQALVRSDSKVQTLAATDISVEVNSKRSVVTSLTPVQPAGAQVALLIDDGLSRSAGIQLDDLQTFAASLAPNVEVLIGYMENGRVVVEVPFTTDHAAAAAKIRVPTGIPGESASPYFCLSDFVKHWPGGASDDGTPVLGKARFVMMITNGVDLYNGSTSVLNQDSPYVLAAIGDAQRAGVAVSSIYYRDAGIRGSSASFSGQSYLQQVADATGGQSYYQGSITPVALTPYFKQFQHDISETYIATFNADATGGGREHLVHLKMTATIPKLKLRHPDAVRPGNHETGGL